MRSTACRDLCLAILKGSRKNTRKIQPQIPTDYTNSGPNSPKHAYSFPAIPFPSPTTCPPLINRTLPFPPPLPQILCLSGHFVPIHKGHSQTSLLQRAPNSSGLPVAYMGSALASHSFPSVNSSPATPPLPLLLQTCPAPSSSSACVTAHSPFPLPQKFHLVFPSQHLLFEALSQFCSAQPPSEQ